MPKFIDLKGQISGTLKAEEYLGNSKWRCKCLRCGNTVNMTTNWFHKNIELGRDGCKHVKEVNVDDVFGYLTVIDKAEDYIKPKSGKHERQWTCRCVCGRKKTILESNLKAGKSTTCGLCNNRVSIPEKMIYYYLSQVFEDIKENYRPVFLDGKEIDIYIPSLNLGIEYDGERWHKNVELDLKKDELCLQNGVHLIRIREPKCDNSDEFEYQIITPKPTTNGTHMTEPIKQIFNILKSDFGIECNVIVDCLKDNAIICRTIVSTQGFNSLALKNPKIASEWDHEKNKPLTPDKVSVHSGRKAWWICPKGHSYNSVIASRTGADACGCPYCSNVGMALYKNGQYIGDHSLLKERPDIAKEFMEEKNEVSADNISVSSNKKMWFKCSKCGHEWQSKVNNRTSSNVQGCPICAKEKQILTRRQNEILKHGSLIDRFPELCNEWDLDKNNTMPWEITSKTHLKAWWICPKGHSYQASVSHRTSSNPTGCPFCRGFYTKVQNVETGEIFNSLKEAALSVGIKRGSTISNACKNPKHTSGGYHWKYIDDQE